MKNKVFLDWQKSRYIFWVFAFMVISVIAYVVLILQVLNVYIEWLAYFNYALIKDILNLFVVVYLIYI